MPISRIKGNRGVDVDGDADVDVDVLGRQLVLWLLRLPLLLVEGVNRKSMAVQMEGMMYAASGCQVEKLCASTSHLYRVRFTFAAKIRRPVSPRCNWNLRHGLR